MRVKSKQRPGHMWNGIPIIDACYLGNDTWFLVLTPPAVADQSTLQPAFQIGA